MSKKNQYLRTRHDAFSKKSSTVGKGYQFAVRDFRNWSVKDPEDQINLMAGNQARIALQAIREGFMLRGAIAIGYSYPPQIS